MTIKLESKIEQLNGIELNDSKILTIGRAESNSIIIDSTFLTANHAKLYLQKNNIYIEDLNSTNGTYIDGKKLDSYKPYLIKEKQKVILGSEKAIFEIHIVSSNKGTKVYRNKDVYTIGRKPSCDIVIDASIVSSEHLKIEKKDNQWYIYDTNSMNGTFLNGLNEENKITSSPLKRDETLYLGNYKLQTNKILDFLNENSIKKSKKIQLSKTTTLGRDPKSDMHINHPSVSFHHAVLLKTSSGYELEDLKSTNGTYVNGKQVKGKISVKLNDEIQVGIHSFILMIDAEKDATIVQKEFLDGFSIEAKNITIEVGNGVKLLDDISFTINPGELVGLMGLSGAGKTTLIKALNGYDKPISGTSLINGNDLYENYDLVKSIIGYVPQDDIVHPELNVGEALRYYAKLRLASDMSNDEIDILIDDTLNKLGISSETKNTLIGSPETDKGISGGQRKRVNLAMELLAKPKVLFLDEPTSGLSAVDTKMVMELLRKLADEGITIIITIHQPSFDNYKIMDNQIILSYGKLAYYGPTFPNSIQYFNNNRDNTEILNNPDNALIGLHKKEEQQGELKLNARTERNKKGLYWKENYKKSKEFREYVKGREGKKKTLSTSTESVSSFKQWFVLTSRYLRIKLKDMGNTSILLGQAPIIAIMIAMLFSESAYNDMPVTLLFVLAISAVWFGTINASREIVSEKPIFERERKVGIKIFPYIMSKFLVLSVLCLIQSIALVGIVELLPPFSLGFGDSFIEILLLIFLTSLSGLSIGLLVSTLAKSQAQALGLIPLVLLPMIIFGGGMLTVKQMNESGSSKVAFYMSQAAPTKWALEEMTRLYVIESDEEKYCKNSENIWSQIDKNNKGKTCDEAYDKESPQEKPLYERCQTVFDKCLEQRDFYEFNYGENSSKSSLIYIILSLFILFPLIIVMIILTKRYKV